MKMKMPQPRGFDLQQRNTMCVRCGAPLFTDVCSRCGTRRPTKGPVDTIKKVGLMWGGDFSPLTPVAAGNAVDTSNANASVTISGITKPVNTIIFVNAVAGFVGTPGANGANASFAGNAMTFLALPSHASGGNTFRSYQGDLDNHAALSGNLVVTWTGATIPDCKVVQYWILPGSGFDALTTPIDWPGTSPTFSFTATPPSPPSVIPSPIVFSQQGPGSLANYATTWTTGLTAGTGAQSGGAAPVALTWAAGNCNNNTWTVSGSGFSSVTYWVFESNPLP